MASKAKVAILMPIKDMDRAIGFYTKALGGELLMRADGEMKDGWASLKVGAQEFWLIAPSKREKRELAYTTFQVKNIKGFVADLMKQGVKFDKAEKVSKETRVEGPIAYEPFGAAAFFKDSEGNVLMVWQNAPGM
jgi:catechol 2,3-dioxygenase-like lactoylglutathione lyase family enzyme